MSFVIFDTLIIHLLFGRRSAFIVQNTKLTLDGYRNIPTGFTRIGFRKNAQGAVFWRWNLARVAIFSIELYGVTPLGLTHRFILGTYHSLR